MSERPRTNPHSVTMIRGHLVITPKYRGRILVGEVAHSLRILINNICENMDVIILDSAICPDHVHLFIDQPPKISISRIVTRIKGASSYELRKAFPYLKKWCTHSLWSDGFYYGAVGNGAEVVRRYIESQEGEEVGG
jgi:putative transposase